MAVAQDESMSVVLQTMCDSSYAAFLSYCAALKQGRAGRSAGGGPLLERALVLRRPSNDRSVG